MWERDYSLPPDEDGFPDDFFLCFRFGIRTKFNSLMIPLLFAIIMLCENSFVYDGTLHYNTVKSTGLTIYKIWKASWELEIKKYMLDLISFFANTIYNKGSGKYRLRRKI